MSSPEQIDKDEDKRVERLRRTAQNRPSLSVSKSRRYSRVFTAPRRILGYSTPAALGDAIRRAIANKEYAMSHRTDGLVEHVRNGKPLTAKGAALLGVTWDDGEGKKN